MFNFFKSKNILRTDGFYLARYIPKTNVNSDIKFYLFFNNFNLVMCADTAEIEDSDAPIDMNAMRQALSEFSRMSTFEPFEDISKYLMDGDKIDMVFYDPDDFESLENGIVNPNRYCRWKGRIKGDRLILNRIESQLNYGLQQYIERETIGDLVFNFVPVRF